MDKLMNYLLGGTIGLAIGSGFGYWAHNPSSVYVRDLNSDNRLDVVVVKRNGARRLFLQREDGTYRILDEVRKESGDSLNSRMDSLETKAEEIR
jgi:hypothetical protein